MSNAILLLTGSELTRGETQDTNGPQLATELSALGARVDAMLLVPDDPILLRGALQRAIAEADLVLFTGGLGPTADDHTARVVGEVFGRPVVRHPEAEARMRARALQRWRPEQIPANFFKQAETVEGAEVLLNPVGLAPGMILSTPRGLLVVMPGVPREMTAMFRDLALPRILERFRLQPPRILRGKIFGLGESWAEEKIQRLGIDFERVEYGISARPGELLVKFLTHRPEDHPLLDSVRERLTAEFGLDLILLEEGLRDASGASTEIEHSLVVHRLLRERRLKVAAAESCTGGLIAKKLTDHAGSSDYFLGSVVAYDNAVKEKLLGVPAALIAEHGAVSEPVCRAMAEGARRALGADLAVADTGIAGPGGGTEEKPVGLVYVGISARDPATGREETAVDRHLFWGNRQNVRTLATVRALELLRRWTISHADSTKGSATKP